MLKTKEEIIAALGKIEGGADFVAGLNSILKEANENAHKINDLTNKLQEIETKANGVTENYNKLADFIGLGVDVSDIDSALEGIRKAKGKDSDTEKVELQSKINELTRSLKAAEDGRREIDAVAKAEKQKRQSMIRDISIRNALEINKALNPTITSGLLRDKVKVNDDDSLSFVADDGSEVTIDEGVKSFLERYPEYRANHQLPGAGGSYGGGHAENIDFDKMNPAEYRKLRKEGKI